MAVINKMTHGIPFVGYETIPISVGTEYSYDTQEFYHGNTKVRLFTNSAVTINYETENTQSSGIALSSLGGSGNLEQVQETLVEETNNVLTVPRNPGQAVDDEVRLLKTLKAAVRYLGLTQTYSLSGRGAAAWNQLSQGTRPGVTAIAAAQGAYVLTLPSGMKIEKVGSKNTNDGNVDTWTGEGYLYTPNTGEMGVNLITLPTEVSNLLPTGTCNIIQQTTSMSGDLKQNVKQTFQVTCHLTD